MEGIGKTKRAAGIIVLCVIMLVLSMFFGCSKADNIVLKENDKFIVLSPTDDFAGKSLEEFMADCKEKGKLDYRTGNGMITSVNGIDNSASEGLYWMLYTDDETRSNPAYGTADYQDKTYAMASYGAESLIIEKGCIYIWAYIKPQW